MSITTTSLGGRLPLAERSALTGARRELFDRFLAEALPWAKGLGFVAQSEDGELIGPFNPLLESPEISTAFWDWQLAEGRNTTLSRREREVVILAVGAVWHAPYELYAHSAAARTAGLSQEQVDTLAGGRMPEELSTRERCAWRFARELTTERHVVQSLYDEAADLIGSQGIVDTLHLIGAYQFVCALLNTFDIPIPEGKVSAPGSPPRA
jgi:4-carboxymuconolactone decarboxylase